MLSIAQSKKKPFLMQSIKARKTQMWLTNALVTVSVCLFGSSYLHTLIDFGLQYLRIWFDGFNTGTDAVFIL